MMSYLWILLLGSLLAGGAKAQDDVAQTDEEVDAGTPVPEEAVAASEPEVEDGSDPTADEVPSIGSETEPAVDSEADASEPETPVNEDADEVTPALNTEAEAAAATQEPAAVPETEAVPVPDADPEPVADPEPAADLDVKDPEADELTPHLEEEATVGTEAPPAKEEDESDGETKPVADPTEPLDEEEPTSEATGTQPANPGSVEEVVADVVTEVKSLLPTDKVDPPVPEVDSAGGFDLEDALGDLNVVDNPPQPGQSRSVGSGAHVAEATGDADKPETKEAGSNSIAAILSTVGVAIVGAVTGYFTYQKKKLCFKNRQEADPEAARKADAVEAQSDPQVLSNLLNSS
ncbi:uncharacterized protein ACBR49_006328 [Aulostomus maculatus]